MSMLVLGCSLSFAQALPPDTDFYNPVINSRTMRLSPGNGNDTQRMQNRIDNLSNNGGGILIVQPGEYQLRNVLLKSNVHIQIDPRATLQTTGQTGSMFLASGTDLPGCNRCQVIENFSITSLDRANGVTPIRRFNVDLTQLDPGDGLRMVSFTNASNFKMADFEVLDNITRFACFAFLPGNTNDTNRFTDATQPLATTTSNGIVENSNVVNASPGWGLVQVQVGNNILFRNIGGTGGVTLRLESGLDALARLNPANRAITKMDNIYARGVSCINGRSPLFMSPHTIIQGFVDARRLVAESCEFAVHISAGFRSTNPGSGRVDQSGLPLGTFEERSIVRNVTTTFGNDAQIRTQESRYIPCGLRVARNNGIGIDPNNIPGASNFRIGPSIAPILNTASGGTGGGNYSVNLDDITATGYRPDVVTEVTNDTHDFENCDEDDTIGFTFTFVPRTARNTPNPLQVNPPPTLSINDIDEIADEKKSNLSFKIVPNPAVESFSINNLENSSISIFSISGKLIKSIPEVNTESIIDISDIVSGLYLVQINNSKTLKLQVK